MKAIHHKKQSKSSFENYLFERNGKKALKVSKYPDVDPVTGKYEVLWLYYNNAGHIGTWVNRANWTFEENLARN
jgi:hypothetical protein